MNADAILGARRLRVTPLSRTASHAALGTLICLPTTSPAAIASCKGARSVPTPKPASHTPAFGRSLTASFVPAFTMGACVGR